jgi:hypothetical protein
MALEVRRVISQAHKAVVPRLIPTMKIRMTRNIAANPGGGAVEGKGGFDIQVNQCCCRMRE